MGSGSFGGGGGGGSGGGGRSGGGGYRFKDGKAVSGGASASKVEKEVQRIRGKLPKDYALKMFCSPLIQAVYAHLFELSVHIFQNRSWKTVTERFGVPSGPGCMLQWVNAVLAQSEGQESNSKVRDTARIALENFVVAALGNDSDLYIYGTAEQILNALDKKVFDSTSGYFLGFLLHRVIERELEAMTENTEQQIAGVTQQLADKIVHSFESKFWAKDQTTHRDLFRVVQENPDWFWNLLRK